MIKRRTRHEADRITSTVWLAALAVPSIVGLALGWRLTIHLLPQSMSSAFHGAIDQSMYYLMFAMGWLSLSFVFTLFGFVFTGLVGLAISCGYREVDEYPAGPVLELLPLPCPQQKASLNQALVEDLHAYARTSPQAQEQTKRFLSQGLGVGSFHLRDCNWVWGCLSKSGIESRSEKIYEEFYDCLDCEE